MSDLLNSDGIPVNVDEGETIILTGTLYDPSGSAFNKGSITDFEATLLNKVDNSVINSRNAQSILDVNGGVLNADGSFELTLSPSDNALVDSSLSQEIHILIMEWKWVDSAAATQSGIQKWNITVSNTEAVDEDVVASATEGLDLSGIKRVKTKHIEIETHDPRVVQQARDKENTALPTFCGLTFCKGIPK